MQAWKRRIDTKRSGVRRIKSRIATIPTLFFMEHTVRRHSAGTEYVLSILIVADYSS